MNQNTVQNSRSFIFGSGKVEVGETIDAMANLGTMSDIALKESWTEVKVMGGNVGEIKRRIKPGTHVITLTGKLMEIVLQNLYLIRGNIDSYSIISGVAVAGANQVVAANSWEYNKFIPLDHQNFDGSEVDVNSVTAATDGVLAKNTDYYVGQNNLGIWGIFIIDSAKVTTKNQNITINTDYTPAAAVVLESGGIATIEPRVVRVTNMNEEGKKFEVTIWKAENTGGMELPLQNDDADDPTSTPISLEGSCDTSRQAGKQLYRIVNEQEVA